MLDVFGKQIVVGGKCHYAYTNTGLARIMSAKVIGLTDKMVKVEVSIQRVHHYRRETVPHQQVLITSPQRIAMVESSASCDTCPHDYRIAN